jgi:hypothetical protein
MEETKYKIDESILNKLTKWNSLDEDDTNRVKLFIYQKFIDITGLSYDFNLCNMSVDMHWIPKGNQTAIKIDENNYSHLIQTTKIEIIEYVLNVIFEHDDTNKYLNDKEQCNYDMFQLVIDGDGTIIQIYCIEQIDHAKIQEENDLKQFPIIVDDFIIFWSNNKLFITKSNDFVEYTKNSNKKNLQVYSLYPNNNSRYTALLSYNENDDYIRLPQYDNKNYKALLVNRYAWGMNPCMVYVDIVNNVAFLAESTNYDFPEGLALRVNKNSDIEIFLSNNDVFFKYYYKNPTVKRKSFSITLSNQNSGWYPLPSEWIDKQYKKLFLRINFFLSNKFDNSEDFLNYIKNYYCAFNHFVVTRQTTKSLEIFKEITKWIDSYFDYEIILLYYNLACVYSMSNDLANCKKYFKVCIEYGFTRWKEFYEDQDIILLHNDEEITKIFTEKNQENNQLM